MTGSAQMTDKFFRFCTALAPDSEHGIFSTSVVSG